MLAYAVSVTAKARVLFIKTLWGVKEEAGNCPAGYDRLFQRIKRDGFDGIETPISVIADKAAFSAALEKHGLRYIAMINTCTFAPDRPSNKFDDHVASFDRLVQEAKAMRPMFINSHSGADLWSFDTAVRFFEHALRVEEEQGIMICHETHRGRILYNPWVTRDLCRRFAHLKLTADLSHFCVVAERVFAADDDDWSEVLTVVADHTRHIHARVGYAQGPQVPDPRAPEFATTLAAHESWWDTIISRQAAKGVELITVEPGELLFPPA